MSTSFVFSDINSRVPTQEHIEKHSFKFIHIHFAQTGVSAKNSLVLFDEVLFFSFLLFFLIGGQERRRRTDAALDLSTSAPLAHHSVSQHGGSCQQ